MKKVIDFIAGIGILIAGICQKNTFVGLDIFRYCNSDFSSSTDCFLASMSESKVFSFSWTPRFQITCLCSLQRNPDFPRMRNVLLILNNLYIQTRISPLLQASFHHVKFQIH